MRPTCSCLASFHSPGDDRCAAQPKVDCPITLHDYGVRLPGPLPSAEFLVANRGQDPLTLNPKLCCGLQLDGLDKPIAPGETRRLIATPTHPLGEGGCARPCACSRTTPTCRSWCSN